MKCPYAVHRISVVQTSYEYTADGYTKDVSTIERNEAKLMDCEQENCAAWNDGRCHYSDKK